jgi:septal ring factor EnvC (AmiA/AmiB activator)
MLGMSFLAPVAAYFAGKVVPWKWIGIGLAVLAIVGSIGGVVYSVDQLQTKYADSQKALAEQTLATNLANQRAGQIQDQHNEQVRRADALETSRKDLTEDVSKLRAEIDAMDLEQDIESDQPDTAATHLNAGHADLNRMLERASRNLRGRAPVDGTQAGTPGGH